MRILHYCQHVLGIGHLFRSLAIDRALPDHRIRLITGGPPLTIPLPSNVESFDLPELSMDSEFSGPLTSRRDMTLEQVKAARATRLLDGVKTFAPHVLLLELYPFGRKAFRFELDPVLDYVRRRAGFDCRIFCSLRDILVEKENWVKHETRAASILNRYFDAVLVHADPQVVTLGETFDHLDLLEIPLVYTGFVTELPPASLRAAMRRKLGLAANEQLVVVSAGGGKVGGRLLAASLRAFNMLADHGRLRMMVFCGPYGDPQRLPPPAPRLASRLQVIPFSPDFVAYLAAADLSISMAGYNTCMNILSTGVPALVWPFAQNREQRLRARRLRRFHALELLSDADLAADALAAKILHGLDQAVTACRAIDLNGADNTARWIEAKVRPGPKE